MSVSGIQREIIELEQRQLDAAHFAQLKTLPAFEKFIKGFTEDNLRKLVLLQAQTEDPIKLAHIARRIDSIGQFQHYLNTLEIEYTQLGKRLSNANNELANLLEDKQQ